MIRQPTAGMAPPTSLTQWNTEQQQSAGQVDVPALLARVQGGLRTQGIMQVAVVSCVAVRTGTNRYLAGLQGVGPPWAQSGASCE